MPLSDLVIAAQLAELRKHKGYADRAFAQLSDEDFFFKLNREQNSIFVYIKHLSGNMKSRFTDFLTSDGEKPWRDRDGEFVEERVAREQIMAMWEAGWQTLFAAIENFQPGDLEKTVTIRNEPHSVALALSRNLAHTAYHVGQIVLLAKHARVARGQAWDYATIPPGGSRTFNQSKGM